MFGFFDESKSPIIKFGLNPALIQFLYPESAQMINEFLSILSFKNSISSSGAPEIIVHFFI